MSEAFGAALPQVGPPLAALPGWFQARDRQVQALEGGLLGREVAAGVHAPPQPSARCAAIPPWVSTFADYCAGPGHARRSRDDRSSRHRPPSWSAGLTVRPRRSASARPGPLRKLAQQLLVSPPSPPSSWPSSGGGAAWCGRTQRPYHQPRSARSGNRHDRLPETWMLMNHWSRVDKVCFYRHTTCITSYQQEASVIIPQPPLVVVMGVTGAGKTTVGMPLAKRLGAVYVDADSLHSREAIAKMNAGSPLSDSDREPWLNAVGEWLHAHRRTGGVIACSALKRRYRDVLRHHAAVQLCFLHLAGDRETVAGRVASRAGHYAQVSLVDSQFEALEGLEPDEFGETLDLAQPPDEIVSRFLRRTEGHCE